MVANFVRPEVVTERYVSCVKHVTQNGENQRLPGKPEEYWGIIA